MTRMRRNRWAGDASALMAGAVMPLAFAPFGIWPVAVIALAVLFTSWMSCTPKQGAWRGWLFGVGMWGAGVYWVYHSLHYFGAAIAPLAAIITSLFAIGLALTLAILGALLTRGDPARRGGLWLLVIAPAAWVTLEWVRSWLLTGFPWLLLGTAQTDTWLAGWAPLIGVYGISLLVAVTAGFVALLAIVCWRLLSRTSVADRSAIAGPTVAGVLVATVWLGGLLLDNRDWTDSAGNSIAVALVQGNVPQELKFASIRPSLERYEGATRELAGEVDLVVWPETAIPTGYERAAGTLDRLGADMSAQGTEVVTGIFTRDPERRGYFNSIRPLGPDQPAYHKQHLVPFGEYMPLRALLQPFERFIDIPMSDLSAGPAGQDALELAGTRFGGLVCYEAAYPGINRGIARNANAIINVSNDAWFGDSTAPAQHLQIARMRSMEVQRPMLRATNTGISAVIDHRGRIIAEAPQFEIATLRAEIDPRTRLTPYHRTGEWPVLAVLLIMIVGGVTARKKVTGNR